MKKTALSYKIFAAALAATSSFLPALLAQSTTWTGSTSSAFEDAANWTNGVPNFTPVILDNNSVNPVLTLPNARNVTSIATGTGPTAPTIGFTFNGGAVLIGSSGSGVTVNSIGGDLTINSDYGVAVRTDAANISLTNFNGARSLIVNGNVQNNISVAANGLTLNLRGSGGPANAVNGSITDAASGSVTSVAKNNGTSNWTLAGTNTYSGQTLVSTGGLFINGNNSSALGAVDVTGAVGVSRLGGVGTIGGATTFSSPTNVTTLTPGALAASSVGVLTFNSALTLNAQNTTIFDVNGSVRGTSYDGINVVGALTYNGTLALNFTGVVGNGVYDLFSLTSQSGSFASVVLTGAGYGAGTLTNSGGTWTGSFGTQNFSFSQGTGDLTITAVPEPSTYAAAIGVLLFGLVVLRRRKMSMAS